MADQIFPEPTVGVFVFNQDDQLLLLGSHKWPGKYVVPGGHVELGERLKDAVIRETKEETGLDIYDRQFIVFQEVVYDPSFWKPRHFIFFDYACRTTSTDVRLNDEAEQYVWVSLEDAMHLPMDAYTRVCVEKLIERRNKSGKEHRQNSV